MLLLLLLLCDNCCCCCVSTAAAAAELLTGRLPWSNDADWLAQVATGGGGGPNSRLMSGFGSTVAAHLPGHGEGANTRGGGGCFLGVGLVGVVWGEEGRLRDCGGGVVCRQPSCSDLCPFLPPPLPHTHDIHLVGGPSLSSQVLWRAIMCAELDFNWPPWDNISGGGDGGNGGRGEGGCRRGRGGAGGAGQHRELLSV